MNPDRLLLENKGYLLFLRRGIAARKRNGARTKKIPLCITLSTSIPLTRSREITTNCPVPERCTPEYPDIPN
jgi:hypothetical protein